jgi:predicted nucleic acid-binding protein
VFIDLALAHRARWLLTRDKALLSLARPARVLGVEILKPQP